MHFLFCYCRQKSVKNFYSVLCQIEAEISDQKVAMSLISIFQDLSINIALKRFRYFLGFVLNSNELVSHPK